MARNSLLNAVMQHNVVIVKLLLEQGANVNALDHLRRTVLHRVVLKPYPDIVKLLLEHGANINALDASNKTPLHIAVLEPHVGVVKLLLEHGANVNAVNNLGQTPLHRVVPYPHVAIAKLLLEHGANVNALDNYHQTPLHQDELKPNVDIVKLLLEHGANINALTVYKCLTPLHYAVRDNHVDIVKLLLEHGANVNAVDGENETPLHDASHSPHYEIVKLLLKHGASVNALNNLNQTPLYIFVYRLQIDFVRLLLAHGADLNNIDYLGHTPLSNFLLLMQYAGDVNAIGGYGVHILSNAVYNLATPYEMVKLLLENGAIPNFNKKTNILANFVQPDGYPIAELLIQYIILRISAKHEMLDVLDKFMLLMHIAEESDNCKHFLKFAHSCINEIKSMRDDVIDERTLFEYVSKNCLSASTCNQRVALYDIDALLLLLRNGKYIVCRDLIFAAIKRSAVVDRLCTFEIHFQTANSDTLTLNYDIIDNVTNYMSKDDIINLSIVFCDIFSVRECPSSGTSKRNAKEYEENVCKRSRS